MASLLSYPLLLRGRTTNRTHTYPINELNIDLTVFKITHSLNLFLSQYDSGNYSFELDDTIRLSHFDKTKHIIAISSGQPKVQRQCNGRQYMGKFHWFYQ